MLSATIRDNTGQLGPVSFIHRSAIQIHPGGRKGATARAV
jgi:hypothetical protein